MPDTDDDTLLDDELVALLEDELDVEDDDMLLIDERLLDEELLDVRLDEEAEDFDDAEEELVLLELLDALLEDDAEDTDDDLLLDDKLLALLDVLLDDAADDIEDEFDDMLLDDELLELITTLLLLDMDDALETLDALLNDMLDDTDEVTEELLPLPAALDELLATDPPVQALIDRHASNMTMLVVLFFTLDIMALYRCITGNRLSNSRRLGFEASCWIESELRRYVNHFAMTYGIPRTCVRPRRIR